MNSFTSFDDILENMPGNSSFQFCPSIGIDSIPDIEDCEITTAITFKTGYSWYNGVSISKQLEFDEKESSKKAGNIFSRYVKGFYPKQSKEILALFNEMKNQKFILKIMDNNGYYRIVGNLEAPLRFNFSAKTGSLKSGVNGYSFMFDVEAPEPSPFYTYS